MKKYLFLSLLLLLGLANPSFADTSCNGVFDCGQFKLTLPVDSKGSNIGEAIEIKHLTPDFEIKPYFYKSKSGGQIFSGPFDGSTTSGSHYPRCELKEIDKATGNDNFTWKIKQGGTLTATLRVLELPITSKGGAGDIVIGQIHGPNDELCRLKYGLGQIYFVDDKAGSKKKETKFILLSDTGKPTIIPLNDSFSYRIAVTDGKILTVTVLYQGKTYIAAETIGSFWKDKGLYFKAGVYTQVGKPGSGAGTVGGSGSGTVEFEKIEIVH